MMASGLTIIWRAKANTYRLKMNLNLILKVAKCYKVVYTKENGNRESKLVMEFLIITKVISMKGIGKTTNIMD